MHMDVLSSELGELDLLVGVAIQYLSLKGFFSLLRPKVSYFRMGHKLQNHSSIDFKLINMLENVLFISDSKELEIEGDILFLFFFSRDICEVNLATLQCINFNMGLVHFACEKNSKLLFHPAL